MRRFLPLLVVLLAGIAGALRSADQSSVPGDFLRYHRAGRMVATGRADLLYDVPFLRSQAVYAEERVPGGDRLREAEFKYAPAMAVLMAPLGVLPPRAASIVWGGWTAALIAAMFVAAWRWAGAGVSALWILPPLVLLARPTADNVNLGQLNPSALVPAALGLFLVARGRHKAGGALVGLGAVVKYMPALLAVALLVQRRWRALAALAATVVVLGVVLPAAVLGPARSIRLADAWITARSHVYTSAAPQDVPGYSAKSFVYRALGDTPYVTNESEVRVERDFPHASLDPEVLRALVVTTQVLTVCAAAWLTRRTADAADPVAASIWLTALLVTSPEARFPHFLYLAVPLVTLTASLVRLRDGSVRWKAALALSVAGALLLNATAGRLVGERAAHVAEFYCAPGWAAVLFAAALALVPRAASHRLFSTQ